jgi:hypothetical protein
MLRHGSSPSYGSRPVDRLPFAPGSGRIIQFSVEIREKTAKDG